jgi:hypothetical protein
MRLLGALGSSPRTHRGSGRSVGRVGQRAHVGAAKLAAASQVEIEDGLLQTASLADEPAFIIGKAAVLF